MTETDGNIAKIIYFYADWCAYCHTMRDTFDQHLNKENSGITVEQIDIDKDDGTMELWGVRNIPIAIALDENGSTVSRLVGAPDQQYVVNWLEQTGLYSPKKIAA